MNLIPHGLGNRVGGSTDDLVVGALRDHFGEP